MSFRLHFLLPLFLLPALAADSLLPVDAREVRVGGEIGRRIDVTLHNNLLALDVEKDFLQPFEQRQEKFGYIGLGKLILSAVRMAAYTHDSKAAAFKDRLVARTMAMQQGDGYIGIFEPGRRITALWDVHELGYLAAGLLADYEFFHREASLAAARKAAGYLLAHWDQIPADWVQRTDVATHVAVTGTDRTFLAFHRLTGDARYLDFLLTRRGLADWDLPLVIGRRAGIEGHMYAYLARTVAQLELYRLRPSPKLLVNAERALDFLTNHDGAVVTGGAGQWEIWTGDQDGGNALAETCATAYQLRLYDNLLRMHGDARLGDLMERTVHNTVFGAQSPDGRRIRYFTPIEGPREYHPTDAYCCPNNYRRIIAELPEFLYYRSGAGITVNLYTASEAKIDLDGYSVRLRQETAYPERGDVLLRVDPSRPAKFPLRLRIPLWAAGAAVLVNNTPVGAVRPGTFLELDRAWKTGDTVSLKMPMRFRLVRGRQRQAGRVAVLRGPLVFTLNPAQAQTLEKLDAAELGQYTLDPASLAGTAAGECRVGMWKPGFGIGRKPELTVTLTPFPDPGGRATYFRLRDPGIAEDDELLK
ncbi:MAG: glycoside hydrolase family 127 protein [Acidobacteria bacterium]|nr:glycoside hydrolase family 127 protein [Acidobacteriota bacterium]